jgi:hypothetical protein
MMVAVVAGIKGTVPHGLPGKPQRTRRDAEFAENDFIVTVNHSNPEP